ASLERAVGEAAGGGANVEHVGVVKVEAKAVEPALEFFAAAGDEALRLHERQWKIRGVFLARFIESLGPAPHEAGHDVGLGLGAGGGEAPGDEQFVEADFFGGL